MPQTERFVLEIRCSSTQSRDSIRRVIHGAWELFELTDDEAEKLVNSAGLSLYSDGGNLIEVLKYSGRLCKLSANALISEIMLRHNKKIPTKQALMAIALSLDISLDEPQTVLKKYGYCLSESVVADMVVKWFLA